MLQGKQTDCFNHNFMDWKQNQQKLMLKNNLVFLTDATCARQYFQCFDFIFVANKLTFFNLHINALRLTLIV